MWKIFQRVLVVSLLIVSFLSVDIAFAEKGLKAGFSEAILGGVAKDAGVDTEKTIAGVTGTVIGQALTLVGLIFLLLMVYAGFLWMTARGEDTQVEKAKKIIFTTVIGLIIVMSAYAITIFVTSGLAGPSCQPIEGIGTADDCSGLGPDDCASLNCEYK